jgi:VWFA-related protein
MRLIRTILIALGLSASLVGIGVEGRGWAQTSAAAATSPQASDVAPVMTLQLNSRITLVDVTVMDSHGAPVHGLKQSDFTIEEDGKPQTIHNFEEIQMAPPTAARELPKLPPNIYTNYQPQPTGGAVNVLLLDALNTGPMDQTFVKEEATRYLKSMKPGTRIAVLGLSSHLRLLQGFTADPAILMAAVNAKKNNSMPSPFIDADSDDITASLMDVADADTSAGLQEFQNERNSFQQDVRTRVTLEALNQIAAYLSGIKGRKNLIWFAAGIPMQLFPQGGVSDLASMSDFTKEVRRTTDLLTEARVAVYPIDARGLFSNPANSAVNGGTGFSTGHGDSMAKSNLAFITQTAHEQLGMEAVAEATGGVAYYNTNGLKEAVGKAVENGANFYTIAYIPPSSKYEGAFHQIKVKVREPELRLSYRRGYYSDDIDHNAAMPGVPLATTEPEPYGSNMIASMGRGVPTSTQLLFTLRVEPFTGVKNASGKILGELDPKLKDKPLTRYDVQYSLPGKQVGVREEANGERSGELEFDIVAYDVYGKTITSLSNSIKLSLKPEQYLQLQKKPFQLLQELDLPPGEIFLRVGVLDGVNEKVGTLEIPLTVVKPTTERSVTKAVKDGK